MSKYKISPLRLQAQRTLITGGNDYPLPRVNITKKQGRIVDTGHNFVVHFADGTAPIPCRRLKDALCYVELCSINKMTPAFQQRFQ